MASLDIKKLRNTRVRLVQEEYALIMGQDPSSVGDISGKEIDPKRYRNVREILDAERERIDGLIAKYSPKRPPELLNPPDLAVLRVAIAETFLGQFVPIKVGINEAVELAKRFGGANSYSFVNGILGNMVKHEFPHLLEQEASTESQRSNN